MFILIEFQTYSSFLKKSKPLIRGEFILQNPSNCCTHQSTTKDDAPSFKNDFHSKDGICNV
jgi:hypothetical protein